MKISMNVERSKVVKFVLVHTVKYQMTFEYYEWDWKVSVNISMRSHYIAARTTVRIILMIAINSIFKFATILCILL